MSQNEAVKHWIASAEEDWEIAQSLIKSKKYNHALFFLQLTLEKLIKAVHIQTHDDHPLYVHNLVLLTQKADLVFDQKTLEELKEISSFNVSARYDSYKRDFYHKATAEFASKWLEKGKVIRNKLLDIINKHV